MKEPIVKTPEQREKRKKFLLFLPVPVLLFSALIFLAFGGGKGNAAQAAAQQRGINTELPYFIAQGVTEALQCKFTGMIPSSEGRSDFTSDR